MSSCDAWIQFVTPSDVRALKQRLNPYVVALEASVGQCSRIDAPTRDSWKAFSSSWRAYYATDDHFLTAGAEFNTGCEFQTAIAGWQHTIGAIACSVPGPALPAPRPAGSDSATASTVRTVAIAAGVVAVAFAIRSFAR